MKSRPIPWCSAYVIRAPRLARAFPSSLQTFYPKPLYRQALVSLSANIALRPFAALSGQAFLLRLHPARPHRPLAAALTQRSRTDSAKPNGGNTDKLRGPLLRPPRRYGHTGAQPRLHCDVHFPRAHERYRNAWTHSLQRRSTAAPTHFHTRALRPVHRPAALLPGCSGVHRFGVLRPR